MANSIKPVSLQGFKLVIAPKPPSVGMVPVEISGWGESTVISWKTDEKTTTQQQGLGGEIAHFVRSFIPAGQLEITLMQTSDENGILSACHTAMLLDPKAGVVTILGKDLLGTTMLTMPTARIEAMPDVEYANKVTERKWVFKGPLSINISGGNISQ